MPQGVRNHDLITTRWSDNSRWLGSLVGQEIKTVHLADTLETLVYKDYVWQHQSHVPRKDVGYEDYPTNAHINIWGDALPSTKPHRFWLFDANGRTSYTLHWENGAYVAPYSTSIDEFNDETDLSTHGGAIPFVKNEVEPLAREWVAQLNGSRCAYEANNALIGTHSFLLGGWFRLTSLARAEDLFHYGDYNTPRLIRVHIDANNDLRVHFNDGTTSFDSIVPYCNIRDLRWHYVGVLMDRPRQTLRVIVSDGAHKLFPAYTRSITSTATLSSANAKLVIGGRSQSANTYTPSMQGEVSNFKLFRWAATETVDYYVIPLEVAHIRDNPASGVTITRGVGDETRHNSEFKIAGSQGAYTYALLNMEEGHYVAQAHYHLKPSAGAFNFILDNQQRGYFQCYAASDVDDFAGLIDNIYFIKGIHFLKLELAQRHASSTGNDVDITKILIWKIDGPDEDSHGAEATSLLDELTQREAKFVLQYRDGVPFRSILTQVGTAPYIGDSASGAIYMSGGLYVLNTTIERGSDVGNMEVWLNGHLAQALYPYSAAADPPLLVRAHHVRLEDGRNDVEIRVNGRHASASAYYLRLVDMRLVKHGGSSQDAITRLFGSDRDYYYRTTGASSVENDVAEFGSVLQVQTGNVYFKRPFAGGLYIMRTAYLVGPNGGGLTVQFDETNILSNVVTGGVTEFARREDLRLIEIPRGYHEIRILNVGQNTENVWLQNIAWHPIAYMPQNEDHPYIEDLQGDVLVAERTLAFDEATVDFELASLYPVDYDGVRVEISGATENIPTRVMMQLNHMTGNVYRQSGYRNRAGHDGEGFDTQTTFFELLSGYSLNGADRFFRATAELEFMQIPDQDNYRIMARGEAETGQASSEQWGGAINQNTNQIYRITFYAAGTNAEFQRNTKFRVYGIRRRT